VLCTTHITNAVIMYHPSSQADMMLLFM